MDDPKSTVQPTPIAIPAAIAITLKQEDRSSASKNDFERVARILSLVAIPVVLAVVGALIQGTLNRSTIRSRLRSTGSLSIDIGQGQGTVRAAVMGSRSPK